ncbi:MAG: choice-of-anchor Q domain-containing protein [Candidatus Sumerlaeia bacterium]
MSFATSDPQQPDFSVNVIGNIQSKPKVLYVKPDSKATAQTPNYGLSWATAYPSFQTALHAAKPGNEIWVAAGTYKPTQDYDQTISFVMPEDVGIYGGFAGTETTRQQRNITTHPTILSGALSETKYSNHIVMGGNYGVLDGFTISDGNRHGPYRPIPPGGGMYNTSVSLTVNKCVFAEINVGGGIGDGKGGAIYNGSVLSTFSNCVFATNTLIAGYADIGPRGMGGAIYNDALSSSTITNSVFCGNLAIGGEYAGPGMGGAIYNEGRLTLTNCTLFSNKAGGGSPSWTVVPGGRNGPDIVYGQPGPAYGGALYSHGGAVYVTNCIFWDNVDQYVLWGVLHYASAIQNDSATMIYKNNDIEGCRGSGSTWKWSYGGDGGGNFELDPWFVNQANPAGPDGIWMTTDDGLRLRSNSLCINHGTNTGAPTTDILGKARISIVDMGSYEFQYGNAAGQWALYR